MSDSKQFKLANKAEGRKLGGVCSGIANYTGIDVTILRLLLIICVLFYGFGVVAYLLTWLVLYLLVGYDG